MKTFTTIQEWLDSSPNDAQITKVLAIVNKSLKSEIKRTIRKKESDLAKAETLVKSLGDFKLEVGDSILDSLSAKRTEIAELKAELEPVVKKPIGKKKETVK